MADPLRIELSLSGLQTVLSGFDKTIDKALKLSKTIAGIRMPSTGGGGFFVPTGGSGGGSNAPARALQNALSGPFAAVLQRQNQLQHALTSGNPTGIKDAQYRLLLAQQRAMRAQKMMDDQGKNPWANTVRQALLTSRYSLGGEGFGLQPLIGRSLAALGPEGAAVGAILTGLDAFSKALSQATSYVVDFSKSQHAMGATGAQTSFARTIASALHMEPGSVSGAADQFARSLASDPWSQVLFGMRDLPGPFGKVNRGAQFLQGLQRLRNMPEDQAIRAAREAGLTDFLSVRDLSPTAWHTMIGAALLNGGAMNGNARRFATGRSGMNATLDEMMRTAGASAMMNMGNGQWGSAIKNGLLWFSLWNSQSPWRPMPMGALGRQWLLNSSASQMMGGSGNDPFASALRSAAASRSGVMGGFAYQSPVVQAMQANTDAINRNTIAMKESRQIIGGGSRAASAVPAHVRYQNLQDAYIQGRLRLGVM